MEQVPNQNKAGSTRNIVFWYLMVLAGAGTLYVLTCAPTILWQDSGLFVYRIYHHDLEGKLGLALAHPLYIMIGFVTKCIPFGDLAYKINLLSAVFGAITIANMFLLLRLWLDKNLPAIIGAVTLCVSWTFWQYAVIAEVYTLFTAQFLTELIVLLLYTKTRKMKFLYLLGLLNGLTIANHMWGVFGLACYTIFVVILLAKKRISLRCFSTIVLLWIIGALPYEYLIIKNTILSGDILGTLASAMFGARWQGAVFNTSISMKIVLENIIFIFLSFPTPNLLLFFAGLLALKQAETNRSFVNMTLALVALHLVFAFRYTVPDRYVFLLPFYCLTAFLIGLGADVIIKRHNRKMLLYTIIAFALLPIPVYCITPDVARKTYKPLGQRRQRPYRDEYTYFLQPWKTGYRGAEKFAEEALGSVEKNAIIYAYTTDVHALLYIQEVKHKRNDVKIVSNYDSSGNAPVFDRNTIGQLMRDSSVYVTSPKKGYCPEFLLDDYDFVKAGVLWRVVKRE
ncbi:hypothetical protein ES703_110873 [subsurface metagenome]